MSQAPRRPRPLPSPVDGRPGLGWRGRSKLRTVFTPVGVATNPMTVRVAVGCGGVLVNVGVAERAICGVAVIVVCGVVVAVGVGVPPPCGVDVAVGVGVVLVVSSGVMVALAVAV